MHFDPKNPQDPDNDRFVLSKGHAAPILYAAWAEAGLFPRERLLELRTFESDLEGHPTPRLPFVDVATGSLGQGICAAVGIALNARRIGSGYRTYVLLGDGEIAEGSVWEAADAAAHYKLDNLCAIVDANALGQSQPTEFRHDLNRIAARWNAFGWKAIVVDGHDIADIQQGLATARATSGQPTVLVARTLKGKGLSAIEGKEAWHGKALKSGEETDKAIQELERQMSGTKPEAPIPGPRKRGRAESAVDYATLPAPDYKLGDLVATREAWGTALATVGKLDSRIVGLDADVKNSTFSDRFEKVAPDRFFEMFIAEQVMVGAAMGFAARGAIPFPSTFACFLYRAADFIRMAGISIAERQAHRLARRRVDWRGRTVADGARGPRHDAGDPGRGRAVSLRRGQHRTAGRRDGAAQGARLHANVAAEDAGHLWAGGVVPVRRLESPAAERERFRAGGRRRHHGVRSVEGLRPAEGRRHVDPRHRCLLGSADRQGDVDAAPRRRWAAWSSPSRTTIRRADLAMPWPKRWRTRRSWSNGSRSARFPAADSRTSWWTSSASRRGTWSTP